MMIPGDHAAERLSAEIQRLSAPSLADRDAVMAELSALDWSIARHLRPLAREAPPAVRDRTLFTLECAAQTAQTRILLAEPAVTLRVAGPTWHPAAERALGLSLEPADELRTRAVDLDIHTINLLIGAKKFIEGWDCWRVSTMGLMHVGKSEGSQIIQLFGRGVRLKGFVWSLKRSSHVSGRNRPLNIGEVETVNVFGVESKFMENFRQFLKDEGLPGNEHPNTLKIPLIVDREEIKGLKIVRQRTKSVGNDFYDFRKDAAVPTVGEIPDYLRKRQIVSDWYPRIQAIVADSDVSGGGRIQQFFKAKQLALLDFDEIYRELERFKRDRGYFNLNISKTGIRRVLDFLKPS